jgi:hypothetical protein
MPAVGRAQSAQVFKWIPQADLSALDPVWWGQFRVVLPLRHWSSGTIPSP